MAGLKKIKIFGCFDLCTSISQVLVTSVSTMFSLYFHFKIVKGEGGDDGISYFSPTFNLIFAALVVYTNIGQVFATRKLVKAGYNVNL